MNSEIICFTEAHHNGIIPATIGPRQKPSSTSRETLKDVYPDCPSDVAVKIRARLNPELSKIVFDIP